VLVQHAEKCTSVGCWGVKKKITDAIYWREVASVKREDGRKSSQHCRVHVSDSAQNRKRDEWLLIRYGRLLGCGYVFCGQRALLRAAIARPSDGGAGGGGRVAHRGMGLTDFAGSACYLHLLAGWTTSARDRKTCKPRLPSGPFLWGRPSGLAYRLQPLVS
jgi:hypothetical protein